MQLDRCFLLSDALRASPRASRPHACPGPDSKQGTHFHQTWTRIHGHESRHCLPECMILQRDSESHTWHPMALYRPPAACIARALTHPHVLSQCQQYNTNNKLLIQTRGSKFLKFQEMKIQELVRLSARCLHRFLSFHSFIHMPVSSCVWFECSYIKSTFLHSPHI